MMPSRQIFYFCRDGHALIRPNSARDAAFLHLSVGGFRSLPADVLENGASTKEPMDHAPPRAAGAVHKMLLDLGLGNEPREEHNVIIRSLVSFHSVSCIRFVWKRNHRDYISFFPSSRCWSYLGRRGGAQPISLQKRGCLYKSVVQHEVLHALCFHHEQVRSDRDDFVSIVSENILPGRERQFRKANTNNLGTPYDYNSIMHYSRFAFSKNYGVLPTIIPKPDPSAVIGQARKMSPTDIKRINELYQC